MKVGTLVELSAAGRKLKWLWLYHGKLGIVLEDVYREDNLYIAFTNSKGRTLKRTMPRKAFRKAKVGK